MPFQYTLTRREPGQTIGTREQHSSGVCKLLAPQKRVKRVDPASLSFAWRRLRDGLRGLLANLENLLRLLTAADSVWFFFFLDFVSLSTHLFFRIMSKLPEASFTCVNFISFKNFLSSVSHTRSLTCRYSLTEETLRLTRWRGVVIRGDGGLPSLLFEVGVWGALSVVFLVGVSCGSWTLSQLS